MRLRHGFLCAGLVPVVAGVLGLRNSLWRCGFAGLLVLACVLGVAGSAWATTAYVTNVVSNSVTPIATATNEAGL